MRGIFPIKKLINNTILKLRITINRSGALFITVKGVFLLVEKQTSIPGARIDTLSGNYIIYQPEKGQRYSTDDMLVAWLAEIGRAHV